MPPSQYPSGAPTVRLSGHVTHVTSSGRNVTEGVWRGGEETLKVSGIRHLFGTEKNLGELRRED